MKHVTVFVMSSWEVHSSPRSDCTPLSAVVWLPFTDKWIISHTKISPEYLLYLQKQKKKIRNPIKKHSKLIKPVHQSISAFVSKCIFATIANFRGNIQKLIVKNATAQSLCQSPHGTATISLLYEWNFNPEQMIFCWHRHSGYSCTLKQQHRREKQREKDKREGWSEAKKREKWEDV